MNSVRRTIVAYGRLARREMETWLRNVDQPIAEILVRLGTRGRCGVALLVRAEWPIAKARRNLIHRHPWFHGVVMLTSRPRWVERTKDSESPRHNFCWCVSCAPTSAGSKLYPQGSGSWSDAAR
jgi:hypothetical protein